MGLSISNRDQDTFMSMYKSISVSSMWSWEAAPKYIPVSNSPGFYNQVNRNAYEKMYA